MSNISEPQFEPFFQDRSTARILHDFGIMAACLNEDLRHLPVLDFGAGTGWITEFVARMGWKVVAFDIHGDLEGCLDARTSADRRIDPSLISFAHGDGHDLPFEDQSFGHILVFDTLHHMHDFDRVFAQFARVLAPRGRVIFVEPGAKHSQSPETIAFMKTKTHDPSWIERDIVLEEVNDVASRAGFSELTIVPTQHPLALQRFSLGTWDKFRNGDISLRRAAANHDARVNYEERTIFYTDNLGPKRANEYRLSRLPPPSLRKRLQHSVKTMLPNWAIEVIRTIRPRAPE